MKKRLLFTIGIVALLAMACGNTTKKDLSNGLHDVKQEKKDRFFQLPEIPVMLDTPEKRAAYLARHYWDSFDFADTAYIHLPDITEQAVVNFMDLMNHVSQEMEDMAIQTLYGKAASHSRMLWYFWETMSRYWHDPNSPIKNEEKFIKMCKSIEALPQVEDLLKQRAAYVRTLAEKNRVGMKAADFVYTLESGIQRKLYDLYAEYTLVFFYDPDCHTCTEVKQMMKESQLLKSLISSGRMKLLSIYPDEDIALWRERLSELASEWVNAYDKNQVITHELLYDLSSMPSLYLLNKDKEVLLKDADWGQVLQFFEK